MLIWLRAARAVTKKEGPDAEGYGCQIKKGRRHGTARGQLHSLPASSWGSQHPQGVREDHAAGTKEETNMSRRGPAGGAPGKMLHLSVWQLEDYPASSSHCSFFGLLRRLTPPPWTPPLCSHDGCLLALLEHSASIVFTCPGAHLSASSGCSLSLDPRSPAQAWLTVMLSTCPLNH